MRESEQLSYIDIPPAASHLSSSGQNLSGSFTALPLLRGEGGAGLAALTGAGADVTDLLLRDKWVGEDVVA